jgi:hypothetical protein
VYHNHLHSRIKVKMHVKTCILYYSANLKAKLKEFFDSIPRGPLQVRQAAPAPASAPADPSPVAAADPPAPAADPAAAGDVVAPAAAVADVEVLRQRNLLLLLRSGSLMANLFLLDTRRGLCRRRRLAGAAAPSMEGQSQFRTASGFPAKLWGEGMVVAGGWSQVEGRREGLGRGRRACVGELARSRVGCRPAQGPGPPAGPGPQGRRRVLDRRRMPGSRRPWSQRLSPADEGLS